MRHISQILWEDREQRAAKEIRAAKARFFRLAAVFTALLILFTILITRS
jgi:hypothetical protein